MSDQSASDAADREIVLRASRGDQPSLDELLLRYLPRLRSFLRLRLDPALRARESCSDLVQTVCREVLQNSDRFEWQGEERFRAWLFQTALNKVRDRARFWKAERRDRAAEADGASPDSVADPRAVLSSPSQHAIAHELSEDMEAAFDLLPEDYREVISLSRVLGLPNAEVASQMGRGEGAIRMLLSRALLAYVQALDRIRGRR